MFEDETYDQALKLEVGDVLRRDGTALGLRSMISRRWGWPRSLANDAAGVIRDLHAGETPGIYVGGQDMLDQQDQVIEILGADETMDRLLTGIARRTKRSMAGSGRTVSSVFLDLEEEIHEDGLITDILTAVGERLGVSLDELWAVTDWQGEDGHLELTIHTAELPADRRSD